MPRVYTKTKSTRGREYTCTRCGQKIEPGQPYHEWSFRYGGTYRQHTEHGYPRPSQLTQSRMGEVYAAVEEFDDVASDDLAGRADAAEQVLEVATEVKEAYEQAAEAFGQAGENQERAEALEGWLDELGEATEKLRALADAADEADAAAEVVSGGCPL